MKRNVLKTAIIGPSFVGKTALCNVLSNRTIDREYTSTIGVDYLVTSYYQDMNLALWDLAGLDRFRSIIGSYINNSSLLIFCYSSESIESYYNMIEMYNHWKSMNFVQNKRVIIISTKIDSKYSHPLHEEWSEKFVKETGYPFFKTSAFSKTGINELFNEAIDYTQINIDKKNKLIQPSYKNRYKSFCCLL